MIDIAKIYRNYSGDAQPFNNFFKSKGYRSCRDYLLGKEVSMSGIVRRTSPSRGHPAVVLVHDLMGLEFVRWLDDSMYYRYMEQLITKKRTKGEGAEGTKRPKGEGAEGTKRTKGEGAEGTKREGSDE